MRILRPNYYQEKTSRGGGAAERQRGISKMEFTVKK